MGTKKEAAKEDTPPKEVTLHTQFRQDFDTYFQFLNGVPAPWSAKEAGQLTRWMKENPTITREQWRNLLRNRRASAVNHALNLSSWISRALTWLNHITDERERPIRRGKTNAIDTRSAAYGARDRAEANRAAVDIALEQAEADCSPGSDGDVQRGSGESRLSPVLFGSVIEGKL